MRIDVNDARVHKGSRDILAGVTLSFEPGAVHVLIGPNGAGKSTLLGILAGDVDASAGDVQFDGVSVSQLARISLARVRAFLPQQSGLRFGFTVGGIVDLGRLPFEEVATETRRHRDEALDALGIRPLVRRTWSTLSGGERQRVQMARIVAQVATMERGVVLLDEPTNHLDIAHGNSVLATARDLAARGLTVVVVLHDLIAASRVADRVVVLQNGRVVADGPPAVTLTPEVVREVFGVTIDLVTDPVSGAPVPLPRLES